MSKYNAKRTEVDGFVFASKAEAARYSVLKIREYAGEIFDLELQPKFPVAVEGKHICTYIADFRYRELVETKKEKYSRVVVEDVKGVKTPVYQIKKKLVEATYNIEIVEVTR